MSNKKATQDAIFLHPKLLIFFTFYWLLFSTL